MAEPARQLNDNLDNRVYQDSGTEPSSPKAELQALERGGETSDPDRSWYKPESRDSDNRSSLAQNEAQAGEKNDSLYKGGPDTIGPGKLESLKQNLLVKNRRKTIAGGGLVGIIISLIFG